MGMASAANTNAEQKARLLEMKVSGNAELIEQLRQERSLLAADHKVLQDRFSKVSEVRPSPLSPPRRKLTSRRQHMAKLRDTHAASQTSHDNRRHELDLRALEIEDLKRALGAADDALKQTESARARAHAEKDAVAAEVGALEADLRRVQRDADALGRDLGKLREQRDRLEEERKSGERERKQALSQIRVLKEELEGERESVRRWAGHVCAA